MNKIENFMKRQIVIYRLSSLARLIINNEHKKSLNIISDVLPNLQHSDYVNIYNATSIYFTINKIKYTINKYYVIIPRLKIQVDDIDIYNGINNYEDKEWIHTLPNNMINELYEESKLFNEYYKVIKNKIKYNEKYNNKFIEEQNKLNKIFS